MSELLEEMIKYGYFSIYYTLPDGKIVEGMQDWYPELYGSYEIDLEGVIDVNLEQFRIAYENSEYLNNIDHHFNFSKSLIEEYDLKELDFIDQLVLIISYSQYEKYNFETLKYLKEIELIINKNETEEIDLGKLKNIRIRKMFIWTKNKRIALLNTSEAEIREIVVSSNYTSS